MRPSQLRLEIGDTLFGLVYLLLSEAEGRNLALAVDMIRALGGGYRVPDATAERR